ncbi:MAG: RNA polymerase sigma factor region1.1 domain-containing protein, partial [Anaerolineales bacterium]
MINEFELLANKVIEATKEVSLSEEEQASIQQLFQLGGEQGYITLNDIASQFPESEASLPVIERV